MPIDAEAHFSGKRKVERTVVNLRVEVRGGGIVLQGRAIDLSPLGVGVAFPERAFQGMEAATDAVTTLSLLQRHFSSGAEVRFPVPGESVTTRGAEVRVFCQLVRMTIPSKPGAELTVGCKFTRQITTEEWAAIMGTAPPKALEPLCDLKSGPVVQVLLFDPATGPGGGPIQLLQITRGSDDAVEAVVTSARPTTADDVRMKLDRGPLPARVASADGIRWDGTVRLGEVRTGPRGEVTVRLDALQPWPPRFLKRLAKPK